MPKRITRAILLYAQRHDDAEIKREILDAFNALIVHQAEIYHRWYPETDLQDFISTGRERLLICINKWRPKPDTFSFPAYLRMALRFSLIRYAKKNSKRTIDLDYLSLSEDGRSQAQKKLEELPKEIVAAAQKILKTKFLKSTNFNPDPS